MLHPCDELFFPTSYPLTANEIATLNGSSEGNAIMECCLTLWIATCPHICHVDDLVTSYSRRVSCNVSPGKARLALLSCTKQHLLVMGNDDVIQCKKVMLICCFQTERAFQHQPTINLNKKGQKGGKALRYHRNVGLGFKTPREVRSHG